MAARKVTLSHSQLHRGQFSVQWRRKTSQLSISTPQQGEEAGGFASTDLACTSCPSVSRSPYHRPCRPTARLELFDRQDSPAAKAGGVMKLWHYRRRSPAEVSGRLATHALAPSPRHRAQGTEQRPQAAGSDGMLALSVPSRAKPFHTISAGQPALQRFPPTPLGSH